MQKVCLNLTFYSINQLKLICNIFLLQLILFDNLLVIMSNSFDFDALIAKANQLDKAMEQTKKQSNTNPLSPIQQIEQIVSDAITALNDINNEQKIDIIHCTSKKEMDKMSKYINQIDSIIFKLNQLTK